MANNSIIEAFFIKFNLCDMLIFKIVVFFMCIVWIFLSIYKQFRTHKFNRNNDPFSLIPIWTLFSPKPMKNNYLLGFRDLLENGETTEINIVSHYVPKWYFALWLGQRRDIKFILGIKKQIQRYKVYKNLFFYTDTYLIISNYITCNYKINDNIKLKKRQVIYFKRAGWFLDTNDTVIFVTYID